MSGINFSLKSADKKGAAPIYLTYQVSGQKFRYYTKLKVLPASWNGRRVKINYTGYAEINGILDDIENTLKEIEREAVFNKKEYSLETIKRKFFLKFGILNNTNDFFIVYDKFIADARIIRTKGTVKGYLSTKEKLLKFSAAKSQALTFSNIDFNFYEAFVNYMIKDLGNLNNTVGKYIKNLKVFLKYAFEREYTTQQFPFKKMKVFNEEADTVHLTEEELMFMYSKKFFIDRLIPIKDVFCFSCFTGLRFSDIDKLDNTHIKEDYLEIKTEKTKDSIRIPLNNFAKAILKKYKNQFEDKPLPTGLTNQKTNEYLKEIAEICKLNDLVRIEQFSGSNRIVTHKKKFEIVTTHTARRTFVTLALEKGIRAEVVMAMTGHKNYKSFMKYVKITDKIMQQEMNRAWGKQLLRAV